MRTKANDGGIRQNSDEDLWLEHVGGSWDFKGFRQTNQAPRQSMEDFIKDHLSCAVILKTKHWVTFTENNTFLSDWM